MMAYFYFFFKTLKLLVSAGDAVLFNLSEPLCYLTGRKKVFIVKPTKQVLAIETVYKSECKPTCSASEVK